MCLQGQTHYLQVQPQTHSCHWFLWARHHCGHRGSMILGQKIVRPLKYSLHLVLSFSTAPFFPILHGRAYCRRSNQGMKMYLSGVQIWWSPSSDAETQFFVKIMLLRFFRTHRSLFLVIMLMQKWCEIGCCFTEMLNRILSVPQRILSEDRRKAAQREMWLSNLSLRIFRWEGRGLSAWFCSLHYVCSLHKYWINEKTASGAWITQFVKRVGPTHVFFHHCLHTNTWKGGTKSHVIPAAFDLMSSISHTDLLFYFNCMIFQGRGSGAGSGVPSLVNPAVTPPIKAEAKQGCPRQQW